MDFSFSMKAQNDKSLRFFACKAHSNDNAEFLLCASNAFVAAVSCKLFGCFVLRSALAVIMSCRLYKWIFRLIGRAHV